MLIADDEPDVIMITEVIPKAQKNPIPDTLLNVEGYEVYKNSRLIRNEVTTEIAVHSDQVWIEIDLRV